MKVLTAAPRSVAGFIDAGLRGEGHSVEVACDVATAMQRVEAGAFEAVILDAGLEGGDRLLDRHPRPPVLALLSRVDAVDAVAQADGFLLTPFRFDQLLASLVDLSWEARANRAAPRKDPVGRPAAREPGSGGRLLDHVALGWRSAP